MAFVIVRNRIDIDARNVRLCFQHRQYTNFLCFDLYLNTVYVKLLLFQSKNCASLCASKKNSIITFAWSHPILLNSHFIGISSHSSASCCFIFLRDSPATPQCSHDKGVSAHSIFTCCYRKGVMKSKIKFKRYILLIIKTTSSRQFKKIKNKTQSEPRDNSQVF